VEGGAGGGGGYHPIRTDLTKMHKSK